MSLRVFPGEVDPAHWSRTTTYWYEVLSVNGFAHLTMYRAGVWYEPRWVAELWSCLIGESVLIADPSHRTELWLGCVAAVERGDVPASAIIAACLLSSPEEATAGIPLPGRVVEPSNKRWKV